LNSSETFDVLDEQGGATGEIKLRSEVHRDGDWHRTVHVWLLNPRGELLLQHRGPNQESNPNRWDVSSAGHCQAGDSAEQAAIREVQEELGMSILSSDLHRLGELKSVWSQGRLKDREFSVIYVVKVMEDRPSFELQASEVQGVQWMLWQTLKGVVEAKNPDFVEHDEEYRLLFEHVQDLLA
jgi:isopentenyldiphosphate isomerase